MFSKHALPAGGGPDRRRANFRRNKRPTLDQQQVPSFMKGESVSYLQGPCGIPRNCGRIPCAWPDQRLGELRTIFSGRFFSAVVSTTGIVVASTRVILREQLCGTRPFLLRSFMMSQGDARFWMHVFRSAATDVYIARLSCRVVGGGRGLLSPAA